ncbi:hypothetical protein J6590_057863 [Homalodisca vitripennis]|nr:hypothetical protein J6590_057863 [Homalodisca vitripennis]
MDQATFNIAKEYPNVLPPPSSFIYKFPTDLLAPDIIFYLNTPREDLQGNLLNLDFNRKVLSASVVVAECLFRKQFFAILQGVVCKCSGIGVLVSYTINSLQYYRVLSANVVVAECLFRKQFFAILQGVVCKCNGIGVLVS